MRMVEVDEATDAGPAYYMVNCAHPTHFEHVLADGGAWLARLRGIRANASCKSHAELDAATELDCGDPVALGSQYASLVARFPLLTILGGCCGTDKRHVEEIARTCVVSAWPRSGVRMYGTPGTSMRLTRRRWIGAPIPTLPTVGDRGADHKQGDRG